MQQTPSTRLEATPQGFLWRFGAMGTQWEIQACTPDYLLAERLMAQTIGWAQGFEARYSRFRPDSLLSRINSSSGSGEWIPLQEGDRVVFAMAEQAVYLSGGLVVPSSLPLTLLWDFKRPNPVPPAREDVAAALKLIRWTDVELGPKGVRLLHEGMGLDFGGFGKEFAVDQLAQLMKAQGCAAGCVNGGGDIYAFGAPPGQPCWHVGLEIPNTEADCRMGVIVKDKGLATSGNYKRFFTFEGRTYGHVIDPRTGYPTGTCVESVTVTGGSCMQAGILATTACMHEKWEAVALLDSFPMAEGCVFTYGDYFTSNGFFQYMTNKENEKT